jgi:hypothetical protein
MRLISKHIVEIGLIVTSIRASPRFVAADRFA